MYTLEGLQGICVVLFHFYSDRAVVRVLANYYRKFVYCFSRRCHRRKFVIDISPAYNENRITRSTTGDNITVVGLDVFTDFDIIFGRNNTDNDGFSLRAEQSNTDPNQSDAKSIKFFVDSVDRKNYDISLSSPNISDDQNPRQSPQTPAVEIVTDTIETSNVEPVVVRHSDGFWFYPNQKLYLKEEAETGVAKLNIMT
jgi:hypothetical protein